MNVEIVSMTKPMSNDIPSPEALIIYEARASSPDNQHNHATADKLMRYLIKNKHWSPLEMVDVTFEIETSRAIGRQLIRHRSFSFSERSQRYIEPSSFESIELRAAATKNRQSSTEIIDDPDINMLSIMAVEKAIDTYEKLIELGVAKECARMILPECTSTTIYMKGSVRSWYHFLIIRDHEHAQKEIQDIAKEIKKQLAIHFPTVIQQLNNE